MGGDGGGEMADEGVVIVRFAHASSAHRCIEDMHRVRGQGWAGRMGGEGLEGLSVKFHSEARRRGGGSGAAAGGGGGGHEGSGVRGGGRGRGGKRGARGRREGRGRGAVAAVEGEQAVAGALGAVAQERTASHKEEDEEKKEGDVEVGGEMQPPAITEVHASLD